MAERDFDAERKKTKKDGHKFTVGGETFRTYPGMSVTFWAAQEKAKGKSDIPLERTIRFLRSLIVKEDRVRFDKLIYSDDVYIEADELVDISNWLIEVISGRPTKSPASSGNGAGRISSGSKAKPSRAGGTGKK